MTRPIARSRPPQPEHRDMILVGITTTYSSSSHRKKTIGRDPFRVGERESSSWGTRLKRTASKPRPMVGRIIAPQSRASRAQSIADNGAEEAKPTIGNRLRARSPRVPRNPNRQPASRTHRIRLQLRPASRRTVRRPKASGDC